MRPGQRYAVAAVLALLALVGIGSLALWRQAPATGSTAVTAPATPQLHTAPPVAAPQRRLLPIEDVLAEENTEEPGAIYFMSRIREVARDGNPAFGRELLRQFKEKHPNSVLVYEAEEVLEKAR